MRTPGLGMKALGLGMKVPGLGMKVVSITTSVMVREGTVWCVPLTRMGSCTPPYKEEGYQVVEPHLTNPNTPDRIIWPKQATGCDYLTGYRHLTTADPLLTLYLTTCPIPITTWIVLQHFSRWYHQINAVFPALRYVRLNTDVLTLERRPELSKSLRPVFKGA